MDYDGKEVAPKADELGRTFVVDGHTLILRKKATFGQVEKSSELFTGLEINEKASLVNIVSNIGNKMPDFMQIVFDKDADKVAKISWQNVDFDLIVEIVESFLSSSEQLMKLLKSLSKIFQLIENLIKATKERGSIVTPGKLYSTEPLKEDLNRLRD